MTMTRTVDRCVSVSRTLGSRRSLEMDDFVARFLYLVIGRGTSVTLCMVSLGILLTSCPFIFALVRVVVGCRACSISGTVGRPLRCSCVVVVNMRWGPAVPGQVSDQGSLPRDRLTMSITMSLIR